MLRKLSLAPVAAASLGAVALAPTSASAWAAGMAWRRLAPWLGLGRPALRCRRPRLLRRYGYGGCYVRRLVPTPWGPRWRLVNRCY